MTELAMGIPLAMKVRSSSDNVRKWILREAAIGLGIPSAVAMRPKRAIQYASGIEKAIRSIARRQQLDVSAYLRNRLRTLERDYESG
jgi:asparagine synthetase B (glutamine-hydrolysing)